MKTLLLSLSALAAFQVQAVLAAENGVNPFFAFCMEVSDAKKRNLAEQAAMLKELGYDGAGHLWLDGVRERLATLDAAGLKLFQVYVRVDLGSAAGGIDPKLRETLPLLKDRGVVLGVLVTGAKPSDIGRDEQAVGILREMADLAKPFGVRLALYPHRGDWLEKTTDAIRVVQKTDRANVGVMFNQCHWMACEDERQLDATLDAATPYLMGVSICGSDTPAEVRAGKGNWIQPLGQGAYDVGQLVKKLRTRGYTGPIGLQCYGLPGDAREHLAASIAVWRRMR